jgi:hypothetical protein
MNESINKANTNNKMESVDANASSVYQNTVDGINYIMDFCYNNPVYATLGAVVLCGSFIGVYYFFTSVGVAKSAALGVGSATLGSTTSSTSTPVVDEKVISSIGEKVISKVIENVSTEHVSAVSNITTGTQIPGDLATSAIALSTALAGFCIISYVNGTFTVSDTFVKDGKKPSKNLAILSDFVNNITNNNQITFFTKNSNPEDINLVRKDEIIFRSSRINTIVLDFNFDAYGKLKLSPYVIEIYTKDNDYNTKNPNFQALIQLLLEKKKHLFFFYKNTTMNYNQVVAVWGMFSRLKLFCGAHIDLVPKDIVEFGRQVCGNDFWKYDPENDSWKITQEGKAMETLEEEETEKVEKK